MRIALVNSGLGLLAAAAELRRLRPEVDLVLSMDPDGMPWGPRPPADIAARTLRCAEATLPFAPDAVILACNSASVHALDLLRARLEPALPVIGTVPAIKPAASGGGPVAVWATQATSASAYQRELIGRFAPGRQVAAIACPGLADAIDAGESARVAELVADAAARTPAGCTDVVLGCTEYELVPELISAALPRARLHGSAAAIAAQALRRVAATAGHSGRDGGARLDVLLSGRRGSLPAAAARYRCGQALAPHAVVEQPNCA